MGKWIKQGGERVQVLRPGKTTWICTFGQEHYSVEGTCQCADEPDVPDNARPSGFSTIRHTRKKPPRNEDGRTHYTFGMTKDEARRHHGIKPPKRSRKKPPPINAPMWEMTNEERARAASRMRNL